jgi:uncharacterized membrane protein
MRPLHPVHAIFLAGALSLCLGALLGDLAYAASFETQWKNFASWLVLGGLAPNAVAAVWAVVDHARFRHDRGVTRIAYGTTTVTAALLGLVNCFVHAGDAWQSMPGGAVLSAVVVVLLFGAVSIAFSHYRRGALP